MANFLLQIGCVMICTVRKPEVKGSIDAILSVLSVL